jgi:hypothetical protein
MYLAWSTPSAVHVRFVAGEVALGQAFVPSNSVFICRYHSTIVVCSFIYHLEDEQ